MADPVLALNVACGDDEALDLRYKDYLKRNLQAGASQVLEILSLDRYRGMLVAFALDPEMHYPSHNDDQLIGANGPRPMVEDYNPAMIYQFGIWLGERYGDQTPNEDSNGDGRTFWGDYGPQYEASGGFGHIHNSGTPPATWTDIDPPRFEEAEPDDRYWQIWVQFKVEVLDDWLEDMVDWLQEAGVPGERIYTHQTISPLFNRFRTNDASANGRQWLDDWSHLETDGGHIGISKYQPYNVGEGYYLYANLARRDDGWGAPEYNPYKKGNGWATTAQVRNDVRTAWSTGAHVLWMHSWGSPSHPAVTVDTPGASWGWDTATRGPEGWATHDLDTTVVTNHTTATSTDAYFESPANLGIPAADFPFFVAKMHHYLNGNQSSIQTWKVAFITAADSAWSASKEVSLNAVRHGCYGHREYVLAMADNPLWAGTIEQLRLYPVSEAGSSAWIKSAFLVKANTFTSELKDLIFDKKDMARPIQAAPVSITLPFVLSDNLDGFGDNFVVYGGAEDGNFGTPGNFEAVDAWSGGVQRSAIAAPVDPLRLSMTKTGKWRKLVLPDSGTDGSTLSFRVGIADENISADGVRFRVRVRDAARELHTLFKMDYRENLWSDLIEIPLTAFEGQAIDLLLETHGISDTTGDAALWGEPVISSGGGGID